METLRTWSGLVALAVMGAILSWPSHAYAQDAVLTGTVADSTGGVLPGVTVTATNTANGNVFTAVTDGTGTYRMGVRVGTYRLTSELSGFQTVVRDNVEVLLGRQVPVDLKMSPATLSESVTVTGEAPLIDTSTATVGSNIDPRQMQDLPVNGRNWMDLALLTAGSRRNESGGLPQDRQGYSQIHVDGQEITTNYHSSTDAEQPKFSRDAIGEFEIITNQFDASIGRSAGQVVNAITRSGTNTFAGTFSGYFRDSKFNAKDFIQNRVLPYQDQQISTTFGGPVVKDRIHFFFNYEREREPKTFAYNSPYPAFNFDVHHIRHVNEGVGRMDFQFTTKTRLSLRGAAYGEVFYAGGGATAHPANGGTRGRATEQWFGTLTHVFGKSVNELKGGKTAYDRKDQPAGARWKGGPMPYHPVLLGGSPVVQLRGYTIGATPLFLSQNSWSARDDFTTSYSWHGRHDAKFGGDYMYYVNPMRWCNACSPIIDATGGAPPSAATLASLFPVWNDVSTWNLAPLSPITIKVSQAVSNTEFRWTPKRQIFATWAQDDWQMRNNLTLNAGVRYDLDLGAHSEKLNFRPWLPGNLPHDTNNIAPRLGFNYKLNDRTVVRGGYGVFFTMVSNDGVQQTELYTVTARIEVQNDGRPDFAANPFNGPPPTYAQALANACDQNGIRPGCLRRALTSEINSPWRRNSYSHQANIGVQRQLAPDMSYDFTYAYTGGRLEEHEPDYNINVTFNPATGANYPFTDINRRPFPDFGIVSLELLEGRSNLHSFQNTFNKRFSKRWQMTGVYTLSWFRDAQPPRYQYFLGSNGIIDRRPIGFTVQPDLTDEYTLADGDQRHRANVNGIWDLGYGVQLSGLYFYGSGARFQTSSGVDRRDQQMGDQRVLADGSIMPRNAIVGKPVHRVDMRLQKRIALGGHRSIDGLFEMFNVFNHANYGSYTTNRANAAYGQPAFNSNIAYQPRELQFGFRLAF